MAISTTGHRAGTPPTALFSVSILISFLLFPIFFTGAPSVEHASVHASPHNSEVPLGPTYPLPFYVEVPSQFYDYVPVDAAAQNNALVYHALSNVSISTAFMTAAQFASFNESKTDLAQSSYLKNGTESQRTLQLSKGDYFLVFYAYSGAANVSYNYQLYPSSPYQYGDLNPPEPSGIASFGLYNDSGIVRPYRIETSEVVGVAEISALLAHNSTAALANSTVSGATLQLNSVLVINETDGVRQNYWIQDTPDFVTGASQVSFDDNLWNNSISGVLSNNTVTSSAGGYVFVSSQAGAKQYYYSYGTSNSTYALPFALALTMNETLVKGQGVVLHIGYQVLRNSSQSVGPTQWFDSITIKDPRAIAASFYVAGNETTPIGTYYDSELVFGGENNGESTNFTQIDASLRLLYYNSTNRTLAFFPSYYSFGADTAEAADNLHVQYAANGTAEISAGTPNYAYLGRASGQVLLSQMASSIDAQSTESSGAESAYSTSTAAPSSTASSSSLSPLFPVIAAVTAIFLICVRVTQRHRFDGG